MTKLKRRLMIFVLTVVGLALVLFTAACLILNSPSFGALPEGERLERVKASPNYRDGSFQNLDPATSNRMQNLSLGDKLKILWRFVFARPKDIRPQDSIPVERHDLSLLDKSENLIVWFGHSGYLLQVDGVRYLVDPVFESGAPLGIGNSFFKGTKVYHAEDMPDIDYLIISHDHWDHLDYDVVKALQPQVKKAYMGLGVGAHFERWGYRPEQIIELDWNESAPLTEGGHIHCLPTQHFSGRGLTSGQSLWASFLVEGREHSVYIGGDGGFGKHYEAIGKRFPKIDLAILENGQYNERWSDIHMLPKYTAATMRALGAKRFLTVHHAKFALAMHPWKEPLEHAKRLRDGEGFPILMPRIGHITHYLDSTLTRDDWWEGLK